MNQLIATIHSLAACS